MTADPTMSRPVERDLVLETEAGLLPVERVSDRVFTVDMGPPRLAWNEIPLRDPYPDTRAIAVERRCPSAPELAGPVGGEHGQSRTRSSGSTTHSPTILPRHRPGLRARSGASGARQYLARASDSAPSISSCASGSAAPALTRACGSAACATLVAAVAQGPDGPQRPVTLPGGDLAIEWRESDDHVLMTGPVELRTRGHPFPARPSFAGERSVMSGRRRHLRLPAQHLRVRGDAAPRGGRGARPRW